MGHDHHDDHNDHDDHAHDDHGHDPHDDHGHADHGPDIYRVLPSSERVDHSKSSLTGYVAFLVILLALVALMKVVG